MKCRSYFPDTCRCSCFAEGLTLHAPRGFSLIELVIVVMIIGVLGAIAVPRLSRGSDGAQVSAFVAELNTFAKLIEQYQIETGHRVADSTTGRMPTELSGYLTANSWQGQTPIGGYWDIEANDSGVTLAVGVHFDRNTSVDLQSLRAVDRRVDDGVLTTGAFRALAADRFYLVLEN